MLQIFLQQCSQLGTDISTVWQSYGGQYLPAWALRCVWHFWLRWIGCIIGFFCGILNTIPHSKTTTLLSGSYWV